MQYGSFDILADLLARDADVTLIRRGMAKTPTERIRWLEEMQEFAAQARKARAHEADRPSPKAR